MTTTSQRARLGRAAAVGAATAASRAVSATAMEPAPCRHPRNSLRGKSRPGAATRDVAAETVDSVTLLPDLVKPRVGSSQAGRGHRRSASPPTRGSSSSSLTGTGPKRGGGSSQSDGGWSLSSRTPCDLNLIGGTGRGSPSPLVGEGGFPRFALRKSDLEIRERGAPPGDSGKPRRRRAAPPSPRRWESSFSIAYGG